MIILDLVGGVFEQDALSSVEEATFALIDKARAESVSGQQGEG